MKKIWIMACALAAAACCEAPQEGTQTRPSEYVTTLMGTQSEFALSTGNTYPAIALPWGMTFWTPHPGRMGNGGTYTYSSHHIRGRERTHQPPPWINAPWQCPVSTVGRARNTHA